MIIEHNATLHQCLNEDCMELTNNIGGLCPSCMGLAQKRAELSRQASQNRQLKKISARANQ